VTRTRSTNVIFRAAAIVVVLAAGLAAIPAGPASAAVTFTVTTTGNASDRNLADAVCDTQATAGIQCTLRAAIEEANDTPGLDKIEFAIPSSGGVKTFTPATPLPPISDPVTINGYTQQGASANTLATGDNAALRIQLNGTNAGVDAVGLQVEANDSTIRGLVINRFSGSGIRIHGTGNKVSGCFIGTNAGGDVASANGTGVIVGDADDTIVGGTAPAGRNLLSGNLLAGVGVFGPSSTGTRVQGNYIGTDRGGTAALGNGDDGVSTGSLLDGRIGGTSAGARNVISGNGDDGVVLSGSNLVAQGNFIGTDATGTAALGNAGNGIFEQFASGMIIGGTVAGARNVISANGGDGISAGGTNGVIQGNYIGLDQSGTVALGNVGSGIRLFFHDNLVGGAVAGARNVISANGGHGILLDGDFTHDNTVQGNLIGTAADGTGDLGNTIQGVEVPNGNHNVIGGPGLASNVISGNDGNGIRIAGGFATGNQVVGNVVRSNALVGVRVEFGPNSVDGNVIFGNGTQGVRISPTAPGVPIRSNQIFGNGALGIDLSGGTQDAAGVTANDTDDPDTGANGLQNYPVLSSAVRNGTTGVTQVSGTLNSVPSEEFLLQFFLVAADPSNHGEAVVMIGQKTVTTNSGGDIGFAFATGGLSPGQQVTATATRTSTSETSEFALNVTVVPSP
jgi:hypothetical protein